MGVKFLWGILSPVKEHKTLSDLRGQRLAVDLSIWVCEAQQVPGMQGTVTKPFLRNLFFRVNHLLQLGINLVFAIEGKAPELKWETMLARQQGGYQGYGRGRGRKGHKPGAGTTVPVKARKPGRSRFDRLLKECCEMLDHLGVPYVQSAGEAEAMCAFLNQEGLVDGVITNDGDAFLYGARTVLRNFTMNSKDPHVECYDMENVERSLGLDRERLVALGLLLGCDFVPRGVPGVGRELAVKLMATTPSGSILNRFENWRTDQALSAYVNMMFSKKPPHCTCCQHPGSGREHEKGGCCLCGTDISCRVRPKNASCSCDWHIQQGERETRSTELTVMKRALKIPEFPDKKVIREFLEVKDSIPNVRLVWHRPKLFRLQRFNLDKLEWPEEYSQEKVLPLVTLWDMRDVLLGGYSSKHLKPLRIVKARVRQGIPCFEIQWEKIDIDNTTDCSCYTTIEEQDIFSQCFSTLTEEFNAAMESKAAAKKPKKKGKGDIELVQPEQEDQTSHSQENVYDGDGDIASVTTRLQQLSVQEKISNPVALSQPKEINVDAQHKVSVTSKKTTDNSRETGSNNSRETGSNMTVSDYTLSGGFTGRMCTMKIYKNYTQPVVASEEKDFKQNHKTSGLKKHGPHQDIISASKVGHFDQQVRCAFSEGVSGEKADGRSGAAGGSVLTDCLLEDVPDQDECGVPSESEDDYIPLSQRLLKRQNNDKQKALGSRVEIFNNKSSKQSQNGHVESDNSVSEVLNRDKDNYSKGLVLPAGKARNCNAVAVSASNTEHHEYSSRILVTSEDIIETQVIADDLQSTEFDESIISGTINSHMDPACQTDYKNGTQTKSNPKYCSSSNLRDVKHKNSKYNKPSSSANIGTLSSDLQLCDDLHDADSSVELFEVTDVSLQDTINSHPAVIKGVSKSKQSREEDFTLPIANKYSSRFISSEVRGKNIANGRSSCKPLINTCCTDTQGEYLPPSETSDNEKPATRDSRLRARAVPSRTDVDVVCIDVDTPGETVTADLVASTQCYQSANKDKCEKGTKSRLSEGICQSPSCNSVGLGSNNDTNDLPQTLATELKSSAGESTNPFVFESICPPSSVKQRPCAPGISMNSPVNPTHPAKYPVKSPVTPFGSRIDFHDCSPRIPLQNLQSGNLVASVCRSSVHSTPHYQHFPQRRTNLSLWNTSQIGNFQIETSLISNVSAASDACQEAYLVSTKEHLTLNVNKEVPVGFDSNDNKVWSPIPLRSQDFGYVTNSGKHQLSLDISEDAEALQANINSRKVHNKPKSCPQSISVMEADSSEMDLFTSYDVSSIVSIHDPVIDSPLIRNSAPLHNNSRKCLGHLKQVNDLSHNQFECDITSQNYVTLEDNESETNNEPASLKHVDKENIPLAPFVHTCTSNSEESIPETKCPNRKSLEDKTFLPKHKSNPVYGNVNLTDRVDIKKGRKEDNGFTTIAADSPVSLMDRLRRRLRSAEECDVLVSLSQGTRSQVTEH